MAWAVSFQPKSARTAFLVLVAAALIPWLTCALGLGQFDAGRLLVLIVLAVLAAGWFLALPGHPVTDVFFLVLMAGVYLARPFRELYPSAPGNLRLDVLGQLMWIRTGVFAVLWFRPFYGEGFGFVPSRRDWIIGLRYYAYFLPAGLVLASLLGFGTFRLAEEYWWRAPATFLGIFLVVALAEEFFFRALLQRRLSAWLGDTAGLLVASLLFGLVHLGFREFPNWKMTALAASAGLFYGRAFRLAGSIRASMVTHALTVTTWRTFLA